MLFAVIVAACASASSAACSSALDCSLNGECVSGGCVCDKPWTGDTCGALAYKTTPAVAKSLYNISDPRNTWNGPIVGPVDGTYHIYNCIYKVGSLGGPTSILHGTSKSVVGPWEWASRPDLPTEGGENAAFVTYRNQSSGATVYSLWIGGTVRVADSPDGPFNKVGDFSYPGGNPAPIYHTEAAGGKGAFFMTNQGTTTIYTVEDIAPGAQWSKFADIDHSALPSSSSPPYYHVEDPFLWIDHRGNWHIINHAYKNAEYEHCGTSTVSAHFFSADGKQWHVDPDVQPYGHTVQYSDGTAHTYTTLERPNMVFGAGGAPTHINLAADLVVGDEGCANRTKHAHYGHTPCDNCKWDDHAGTIVIALEA
eukprot:g2676.t1